MGNEDDEQYEHRECIDGVPHCPACGGMLWPPDWTEQVVTEDGEKLDTVLDAEPGATLYHEECYDVKTNGGERMFKPAVKSENDVEMLKR